MLLAKGAPTSLNMVAITLYDLFQLVLHFVIPHYNSSALFY